MVFTLYWLRNIEQIGLILNSIGFHVRSFTWHIGNLSFDNSLFSSVWLYARERQLDEQIDTGQKTIKTDVQIVQCFTT